MSAITKVLKATNLTLNQIDLIEINEAFSSQVLACRKELGIDLEKLNQNGGAIALGKNYFHDFQEVCHVKIFL